jgi:hypothetical protein
MSRSCVCGGSNENCRYCNGLGSIPDSLANAITIHSYLPEAQKVHVGGKKQPSRFISSKPAGLTKWEARWAKLKRLRANIFGEQKHSPIPAPAAPPTAHWVLCPKGCGAKLNKRDVDQHLRQAHKPAPVREQQARVIRPTGSKLVLEFCPVCRARVRTDRLDRHLRKVHRSRPLSGAAKPNVSPSATDVLRDSTTLAAPRDKNLDATKLYAHSYREHGRFRSHPSHDGFDDESGPD